MKVMILRLSVMVWLLSYATAAFGSNGPGLAFSREAGAPRMEVGIRLAPVQLKTDWGLNENTPVDRFDGVFVSMDLGEEPIPVLSANISNNFCSVATSTDSDCSIGGTGVTATECSVVSVGTCTAQNEQGGQMFCSSISAPNNNGVCSVNGGGSGKCSVHAGHSKCSAQGSSGATANSNCSVAPVQSTNVPECSSFSTGAAAKCSAFGSGAGVRFCSVVEFAGHKSKCTAFSSTNVSACSVHSANGDTNTKCSVLRPNGNVDPPNASGKCEN